MMVKTCVVLAAALLAVTTALACSSNGDTAPPAAAEGGTPQDGGASPEASPTDAAADAATAAKGAIQWKDDGTQNSADGDAEALVAGGIIGFALNVGDIAHGNSLSLNVVAASAADWKPGTYPCPSPASAGYVHSPSGGVTFNPGTCSVTVTQIGAVGGEHLKGTFEATFGVSTGGTKALSAGSFDVAYKMP